MTPTLSIIIPCLNEAAEIAAILSRLQSLRGRGAEVIVVDGGSSDGTAARARPYADRVFDAPRGRAAQMNAGAAAANADVLLFLHADCLLPAGADQLIRDGLATSGKSWGRFDVEFDSARPLLRLVAAMINLRSRVTGIATGDQGLFMRRSLFAAVNGFPPIPLMEDIAMSRQLGKHGRPLCLRERLVTSARRWEKRGAVSTIMLMWRMRLAYFFGADPAALALRYDAVRTRR